MRYQNQIDDNFYILTKSIGKELDSVLERSLSLNS